jgi:hypothetical protein
MPAANITSNYNGEFADTYLRPTVTGAPSMDNLTFIGQVSKSTITFGNITDTFGWTDFSCDWVGADVNLSEVAITLKKVQITRDICKNDFATWWESKKLGWSEHDMNFDAMSYADALILAMQEGGATSAEDTIWHGDGVTTGQWNGFVPLMAADATVIDVSGAAGGVTSANVIAELGKVVAAIPKGVYAKRKEDLAIYCAVDVMKAYRSAQSALGAFDAFHEREADGNFEGVKLIETQGLQNGYMVAARKSNLFVGMSLKDDFTTVKTLDLEETQGIEQVRAIMKMKINCNFGIGAECVLYTPGA